MSINLDIIGKMFPNATSVKDQASYLYVYFCIYDLNCINRMEGLMHQQRRRSN